MQFCSLEQKAAIQVENILICGHTFANYHRSVSFINNKKYDVSGKYKDQGRIATDLKSIRKCSSLQRFFLQGFFWKAIHRSCNIIT